MSLLNYKPNLYHISAYTPGVSKIAGIDKVIKLSSNESPYACSQKAVRAYQEASELIAKYPDGSCFYLKQAIADFYDVDKDRIICGAGSDNILELLAITFIDKDDEVIFTDKSFPVYRIVTHMAGGTPVEVPYTSDYRHDIDGIIQSITPKTKIIFIASPDNPTGSYVTSDEMHRLLQATPQDCLVVIDEAYYEFIQAEDAVRGMDFAHLYPNVAVTRTFSKVFGLASLRVGWGYLPPIAYEGVNRIRSPFNINTPAQMAAIAALDDKEWLSNSINSNNMQRKFMEKFYDDIGYDYIPSQANFICLKRNDAQHLFQFLQTKGIIVRTMSGNGSPELLRISLGTQSENEALQKAMTEYSSEVHYG